MRLKAQKEKEEPAGKGGFWGKRKGFFALLASGLLLTGFLLGQVAGASPSSAPGSEGDPLVTASWVEEKLDSLASDLKRQFPAEGNGDEGPRPPEEDADLPSSSFEVVTVPEGHYIFPTDPQASTEFILRAGKARAEECPKGNGLADLTAGINLSQDKAVQRDHLIAAPLGDGRGIYCSSESIFMVRGDFNKGSNITTTPSRETPRERPEEEPDEEARDMPEVADEKEARVSTSEGSTLSIRRSPGSSDKPDGDVVESVRRGEVLIVLDTHNDERQKDGHTWWEVRNPESGVTGWVAAEYLQVE